MLGLPCSSKNFLVAPSNLFVKLVSKPLSIPAVKNSNTPLTALTGPSTIPLSNSFAKSLSSSVSLKPF